MALSNKDIPSIENEDFRMYHQLQYDRIAQLEQQRLTMTNFVIGLSIISFSFAFSDIDKLNIINAIGLPAVIIISNIFAMLYASRSRIFIKMHQKRAEKAREIFSPNLNSISKKVPKINSNRDPFNRTRLQIYLHVLLIVVAILPAVMYFVKS